MNYKIKFVYFDVGGVLNDEGGTEALKHDYGVDTKKLKEVRKKYLPLALTGKITADEMLKRTLSDLGISIALKNYNKYWSSNCKPYPVGQQMLELISKHYPVGLLTNSMIGTLGFHIKFGKIPDINYSVIIDSSEVKVKKPNREIYKIAEEKCGYSGSSILFIDDRDLNLVAAGKLGWRTFLYDKHDQKKSADEISKLLDL